MAHCKLLCIAGYSLSDSPMEPYECLPSSVSAASYQGGDITCVANECTKDLLVEHSDHSTYATMLSGVTSETVFVACDAG